MTENTAAEMNPVERALRLHEENHRCLRHALETAGGSLDALLRQPLSDVLRSLAQNGIAISATND